MKNRVRETRTAQGITQVQLAVMTGLTQQAISRIDAGQVAPKFATQVKLAEALGTTIEYLFGDGAE